MEQLVERLFGTDKPVAQLALPEPYRSVLEHWFSEEKLNFTAHAQTTLAALPDDAILGPEPIIVALAAEEVEETSAEAVERLQKFSERAPIIAILDADLVEYLGPFMDVDQAEYLSWPSERDVFMSALQQISSGVSLRERAESQPARPDALRDEVQRIAQALSALVENNSEIQNAVRTNRSAAESAALLRQMIRKRRARAQFFPAELFADPAWDILLDLAAARHEGLDVSISSLCIAAAVPTTTALRWIKGMTAAGILERQADPEDGRRSFVKLSETAAAAMENYLSSIEAA